MHVNSMVSNRFVHTVITSSVTNAANTSQETAISLVLSERAYITGFLLEIGKKKYEAYVMEKGKAKTIYDKARESGRSAAHVVASARDSNRFEVSVNLEPGSKIAFELTYEELLKREDDRYEIVINIHPGQPVRNMTIEVNINESRPLRFVNAPFIRSGNEICPSSKDLDPNVVLTRPNSTSANIEFNPNLERQKQLATNLGTDASNGLAGQFVVQYDVERDPHGGEVLLQDGYFVHFFSPKDVTPFPKQLIFVLDTSGSMLGRKMDQLKQAMKSILLELKLTDTFNLVQFSNVIQVHNVKTNTSVVYETDNINSATGIVHNFKAEGITDIYTALEVSLRLVDSGNSNDSKRQPLIMFLYDGTATVGITKTAAIISKISKANTKRVPIFALSFGESANKTFLRELALDNRGFSRHIYEAADASLQLENFYRQISSPLLTDVYFKYTPNVSKLTKTAFPILFAGSELIVGGEIDREFSVTPTVEARGVDGPVALQSVVTRPVAKLERVWAYLTIKQMLEERESAANKTGYEKAAVDLALKYSFVTPVSSLVVVKPNSINVVEPVRADKVSVMRDENRMLGESGQSSASSEVSECFVTNHSAPRTHLETAAAFVFNLDKIQNELPWINKFLSGNSILLTERGTFNIGLNESISNGPYCTNTANGYGKCKLLHECPLMLPYLRDVYVFFRYQCSLQEFTGVCSPIRN